jgi:hypothetical protein
MHNKNKLIKAGNTKMPSRKKFSILSNTLWLLMLLPAAFMWQCKKDDLKQTPNASGPVIVSTDPAGNDTNVVINKILIVTFNETMDSSTINRTTFILKKDTATVAGTVTYAGNSATFEPAAYLAPNTQYTATITAGAKDPAGKALAANHTWSFKTGTGLSANLPKVIFTSPASQATAVPRNAKITAVFSKTMASSTLTAATVTLKQGNTAISGTVSYSGTTVTYTPAKILDATTSYTATISTGAKDVSGNALATDFSWNFTTGATADTVRPRIISTDPASGASNVALNKVIKVVFSKSIESATINSTSFTLSQGTNIVPGAVILTGKTAVYTPSANLLSNTVYTVRLTNGVKDSTGNSLASGYTGTFTTGVVSDTVRPTVLMTDPINGAFNVVLNQAVRTSFSEQMDPSTINTTTYVLSQGTANIQGIVSYSGTDAVFTPSINLASGTMYTARITNKVRDLAGNAIAADHIWTFTTATTLGPKPVELSSAGNFAILSGAGITNSGPTVINGDIGTSPTGTINGFPPGRVNGNIHAADPVAAQAKKDLTSAYNEAQGRSTGAISLPGDLKGLTFYPGLYSNSSTVMLSSGNLTLDAKGDANAMFIFKVGSSLTTSSGTKIILTGGAQANNIFWSVGSSATLGTYSVFYGNILADQSISLNTGATLNGRALTRIASVTLLSNTINMP